MNTRSFLKSMLMLGVGTAILPSAVTYSRRWIKPSGSDQLWKPNPAWVTAEYEVVFVYLPSESTITPPIFKRDTEPAIMLDKIMSNGYTVVSPPMRYNLDEETGLMIRQFPFKPA